jgi:preprotein translocase subunit SecA
MDGIKEESVGFLFNLEVQLIADDEQEQGFVEEEVEEPLRRELRSEEQPAAEHDHRPQITAKGLDRPKAPQQLAYSAPSEDDTALAVPAAFGGDGEPQRPAGRTVTNADDEYADVGRNALCPCGSGKKYKRCHGAPGGPTGVTARIG